MLFAHIREFVRNDFVDLDSLPKFKVWNDAEIKSVKVVHSLSKRFASGERCSGSDVKNWTLTVELKPDKRYVHLGKSVPQKDASNNDDSHSVSQTEEFKKIPNHRELIDRAKSFLQELAQTSETALSREIDVKQKEKQSDVVSSTSRKILHSHKRMRKKPNAMEETWDMLDNALYQRTKSSQPSQVKFMPVSIPLEDSCATDPRLMQTRQSAKEELNLPLPLFKSQKPIDVIVGIGREGDGDAGLMESLRRSVHLLSERGLGEFSRELNVFSEKIAAVLLKDHDIHSD